MKGSSGQINSDMTRLKLVRSLSSLYYHIESPWKSEHTSPTARSNQLSPRYDNQIKRWHNSPPYKYSNLTKTNFFYNKVENGYPLANRYSYIAYRPQNSNTRHIQNNLSQKEKLRNTKNPQAQHKNTDKLSSKEDKNKNKINSSQKSLKQQKAFVTESSNHLTRMNSNLNLEKKGLMSKQQEKRQHFYYSNAFFNPNQVRKMPSKDHTKTTKQEKKHSKPKQAEKLSQIKENNTFQSKEKEIIKRQRSLTKLQKMKRDMMIVIQSQKGQIAILSQMLQSSKRKNIQMQNVNNKLQHQLSYYKQLSQSSTIQINELKALIQQLKINEEDDQNVIQSQMTRNRQLSVMIANMKEEKEGLFSQFKQQYELLANRLKERESVMLQLQNSNSLLREQYSQLRLNVQRITEERRNYLNQQLDQQSFSWEENQQRHFASSIK